MVAVVSGEIEYVRKDGTLTYEGIALLQDIIAGAGGSTDLTYTAATRLLESSTGTDVTLPLVTSPNAGLAPASGGGTTNFLRADGTWAAPGGGGATNLSYTAATRVVASDTGTDATLTLADGTNPGLMVSADFTKLAGVASGATAYTDELAQDAVGAMVDTSLTYVDGTPLLQRAALTGAVTAAAGSNATALGSFTKAELDGAVSDGNVLYVGDAPTAHTHVAANVTDLATVVQAYTLDTFANPVAAMDFAQQQTLQFVIENRTSDPGSPATGQMWLRVDL